MKTQGSECRHIFLKSALITSGQLHAPAALPRYPLYTWSERSAEGNILDPTGTRTSP
jgi:hypothetical protein